MNEYREFGKEKALWVWEGKRGEEVNTYVQFRHEFAVESPACKDASLCISVDTDYAVWINGRFVDCGQYDDFPANKAYDKLQVGEFLRQGSNVLCILAYHQGENSYQYIKGEPGLLYLLDCGKTHVASGGNTMCRRSSAYRNGNVPKVSNQLGFTFEYDAGEDDLWTEENYAMGDEWRKASPAGWSNSNRRKLYKRPVKKLDMKDRVETKIATQGVFMRRGNSGKTVGQKMQTDFLSNRLPEEIMGKDCKYLLPCDSGISLNTEYFDKSQGIYLVLDVGKEEVGLFNIELESDCGAVVDVAYGEHLLDMRVTSSAQERNFADRYICREGRQNFTHYFTRFGGRYIQLHISNVKSRFTLYYAGLVPMEYPVEPRGDFSCSDLLHNRIYEVGVRTLHLCMHEHYEDTPLREQALYSMDSRNQALCGYYCFGEYDYPRAAVSLLAESLRPDGYLEMCAPAKPRRTIPSFSMIWIQMLYELHLYSGNNGFVEKMLPTVKIMLDSYIGSLENYLMPSPRGDSYWNFYEWADGLSGRGPDYTNESLRYDAPLNLFMYMALDAAEKLFDACGKKEDVEYCERLKKEMARAIHASFWNDEEKAYITSICDGVKEFHYAELTQSLALYTGVCPISEGKVLRAKLAGKNNGYVPITLSYSIFKFEAMLMEPEKYGKQVFEDIADIWGHMLYNNATSFWETINVPDIFRQGWSFCHGWSAVPVYLYHAYILGIKPVEPGFAKFKKEPVCSGIDRAWGVVPTPCDIIEVKRNGT